MTPADRDDSAPGEKLRSYAPIGDGRTIALVGLRGQVDWLPLPELDALPLFARLLDHENGGSIDLEPVEPYEVSRRYVADTNVLETTFTTAEGVAKVTDAMVTGVAGRLPWAELARRIDGVSGRVPFTWKVEPGTALRSAAPWMENTEHGAMIRCGLASLGVVGIDHGPRTPDADHTKGPRFSGAFTTAESSRHLIVLAATHDEPLHFPDPANVDRGIDRTIASWRAWSEEFDYSGPWSHDVQRSALALKLLIFSPSGAIAAAGTTSLPESPHGGKNWDYRFAWVRDLAYTANALDWFGLREETHAAISWMLRTIREQGPDLEIFYTLDGRSDGHTHEYDVPGWRGIGPVVTGNPAHGQLQLGVFGDLLSICRSYVEAGNVLDIETGRLLSATADRVCDSWRSKDSGMWELPEQRHYTSSKMGCWQALNDAISLAEAKQIPGSIARWVAERDRIKAWVEDRCWSTERGAYVMYPGSAELDASVLLHAPSGFDRGERMASTIDALTADLSAGPLLYRYTGAEQEEHTFVACAFWRAAALACVGRRDEAISLMDELVDLSNDVGIFSEMIAADDHAFWGNLPQALSHLALISAALTIRQLATKEELGDR